MPPSHPQTEQTITLHGPVLLTIDLGDNPEGSVYWIGESDAYAYVGSPLTCSASLAAVRKRPSPAIYGLPGMDGVNAEPGCLIG